MHIVPTPPPRDTLASQQQRLAYLTATNPRHLSRDHHGTAEGPTEEAHRAELEALRLRALGDV